MFNGYINISNYNYTLSIPDTVWTLYEGVTAIVTCLSARLIVDIVIYFRVDVSNYNDIYILSIPDAMLNE